MQVSDPKDASSFKKLGIKTLLDLALTLPHHFDDTTLTPEPDLNRDAVIFLTCKSHSRRPRALHVDAWCDTWDMPIVLVFFHPKPFHFAQFKPNATLCVKGKLQRFGAIWQLIQPKVVSQAGSIIPQYKTPLRSQSVANLVAKYLNQSSLESAGLKPQEAEILLRLHEPTLRGIRAHQEPFFSSHALGVLKFTEALNHLRKLAGKKRTHKAQTSINANPKPFIDSLPYKLTNDQLLAIKDITKDISGEVAARRVVMGDVGCGKTVVMLAVMAMIAPRRSVLMVPTTVLAAQIFAQAKELLPPNFPLALVAGKQRAKDLQNAVGIIGTHALLYEDLPKCDVVMVDEQHRFGTKQRDLLHKLVSQKEAQPHFFQFTATPIPRTLSMMHATLVQYSFIKQIPFKKDITTRIIGKSEFGKLLEHIKGELAKGNQVAIIYPLTQESETHEYQSLDEGRGFWEERFDGVFVTHGKDREKEAVLEEFAKNGKILLATTVVEVGISLSKLSTIVIVGAERMGLATLHQLRGRVSRTGLKGYCFLFTYKNSSERLTEFTQTTDGFAIAELDLKYRQGGSVLDGAVQHGDAFKWFEMSDIGIVKRAKERLEAQTLMCD
jgi:ATP-dependent DNA helicase RecG